MSVAETAFWLCCAWVIYAFAGYPLVARTLAAVHRRPTKKGAEQPMVTVVIPAFNEVNCIEATVRNKLGQTYPTDRLDVLVVSDASDDGTDEVVGEIADPRVRLIRQEPRRGKTAGLNLAVAQARGEIIVFSDANSIYEADAIARLVENFADPSVGYVTGKMLYQNPDGSLVGDGCTGYMRYENALRAWESTVGSVVGVDGGVDAVRKSLYRPMRPDQIPDFVLPLSVVADGYRVVYEPAAVLREDVLVEGAAEFRMRVRVSLRSMWALWDMRRLFNPFRYRLFAFQLFSHKLVRYTAFIPLLALLPLNLALASTGGIYAASMIGQLLFYLLAAAGGMGWSRNRLSAWPWYFTLVNAASGVAFVRFIRGHKQVLWQPRHGA